ncbi:UbiD family decarboxylase domain-containing protein [Desulfurococcus mucosus]|uniref:Anhydromevalonate phosphate decarboxylase n=1 Tax=Desulfurococcus mucosus (strain ATCC 35584 / DSM 2162 / JCM 9187 / O7/1) TaxID=765177 RepID=E8R926_DESM0|nr:UbiD family decarboxylase domain-containing protein [Desulfurococcus mucosus]ADV65002.1 Carboxylyase-related protein [Desulfurococcus mucosus DSM 2162]
MDLELLEKLAKTMGKEILDAGVIDSSYEITRIAWSNRDRVVVFKVRGREWITGYTNLVTRRRDVYRLFNAGSDEELYKLMENALNNPAGLVRDEFHKYFRRIEGLLDVLPFIKYYREDGGYYLTSSVIIACTEEYCNSSFHRVMYHANDKATLRIVPRHLHYIVSRNRERGRDTPVALVLGLNPFQELAAAMNPPLGVFEVGVGAALGGGNMVAETPLYRIPVPVDSSVVVEGVITGERDREGPFTDILMLVDPERKEPVFKPLAVYVARNGNPVFHAIVPGSWEHQFLMGFPREPVIYSHVKRIAPGLKAVRLTEGGSGWLHVVVSLKQMSPGDARLAGLAVISAHPSVKHVIVVDDDIDVDDPLMVEWAIATRMRGSEDLIVLRDVKGSTLDPRSMEGLGDKVVFIAVKPFDGAWDKYRRVEIP